MPPVPEHCHQSVACELSTVPPYRCTTAAARLTNSAMISRSRSAPTVPQCPSNEQHRRTAPSPACTPPIGWRLEWRTALVTELGVRRQFGAARPTGHPRRGQSTATIPAGVHVSIVSPLLGDVCRITVPSPIRSFETLVCRPFRDGRIQRGLGERQIAGPGTRYWPVTVRYRPADCWSARAATAHQRYRNSAVSTSYSVRLRRPAVAIATCMKAGPVTASSQKLTGVKSGFRVLSMAKKSERELLDEVVQRIAGNFSQLHPGLIATAVEDAYVLFEHCVIRDYIPLLVERRARARNWPPRLPRIPIDRCS